MLDGTKRIVIEINAELFTYDTLMEMNRILRKIITVSGYGQRPYLIEQDDIVLAKIFYCQKIIKCVKCGYSEACMPSHEVAREEPPICPKCSNVHYMITEEG